jgi:uncharacterized protein YndB with AHSA1/START domain
MPPFTSSREIPAPPERVFAAFTDPARLARWWGPAGFSNTFTVCEFKTGGRWLFVMHGPDGKDYANESVFAAVEPPGRVVIDHVSLPHYQLTITLTPTVAGTRVGWEQVFENDKVAAAIAHIVEPANEENLERLATEVRR